MRLLFRFGRRYAARYWLWYLVGVGMLFLTNWLAVNIPLRMAEGIDAMRAGLPDVVRDQAIAIGWMGLAVIVVRTLSRILFFTPGRLVEFHLKNDLFKRLTELQPTFYARFGAGDIVSRATSDITYLRALIGFGSLQVFNVALALGLTGREMFALSPKLSLMAVVPIILGLFTVQVGLLYMHRLMRLSQQQLSGLSDNILGALQGVRTIQDLNAEESMVQRFLARNRAYLRTNIKLAWVRSTVFPLLGLAGSLALYLLLAVGGPLAIEGELTVGELVAFVTFIAYLLWPLMSLGWLLSVLQRGLTSLERLDEILYSEPDRPEGEDGVATGSGPVALKLTKLSFRYPDDPDRVALDGLTVDIEPGQVVGIYGRTGSGKSTLLRVLTRAWNPEPGMVTVDGTDLTKLDLQAWRRRMAVAPQTPFLFSDTIANNIAMGDATEDEVRGAAARAALSSDLEALPDGLQTLVGQRGIMLSGGQRQRSALARALVRDFDLLVLDDVLSAVDQATEQDLIDVLVEGSATTLIVSHRMSVLARTDLVLVMDEGRLVASGPHELLREQPGPYRDAWEHQQDQPQEVPDAG
jgi:ATP-binding cassette, subfamily B, multidrug efflux pump